MSWDHYRSFLAVLQSGSLSAAARALGLTQPTLGRHIEALEANIGAPLFLRSVQGLLPTATALAMRPLAESMETSSRSLSRLATASQTNVEGVVRISASDVMAVEVLPPILSRLQTAHPGLHVELSVSDRVEDLLQQEADIAVRMVAPRQKALVSRAIGALDIGFYAHRRYLDQNGRPENLEDLRQHRLIGYDRPLPYIRAILEARPDLAALTFAFRADSNLAQLAAIRSGLGIGMCQAGIARRDDTLEEVLSGQLHLTLPTYVVMHENLKTHPPCRATFDALVAGLLRYRAGGASVAESAPE
ncbi:DNA-binding transcriptional LysR family regulator [Rhizobium paknamense]|uniref:DNA-binding transcriptional LysR family regulator n=1 Tax=Rhizobium paknamense TaxID=1206817 RepID=A0ABU0IA66_9HYPH|nr:DNA-binding transcriptional LysR family regulator [Rhizobium paknamense]